MRFNIIVRSMLCAAALATPVAAQDITIRVTFQNPLLSDVGDTLSFFETDLEERSGGAIDVELYPSSQLFKDDEVPEAVSTGQIEMGVTTLTQYTGEFPAVDIFFVPFLFNSEEKVRAATAPGSPVRGPLDEAILETGARVMWWQSVGGVVLLSKGDPIERPEDMQGLKVRVFGRTLGQWVEVLGGSPTIVSGSEQLLAYQRGTVDVGMTGITGVTARRLYEVMDAMTVTYHADVEFVTLISEPFWSRLTEEQQGWVTASSQAAEALARDRVSKDEQDAISAAQENGMSVYILDDQDVEAWRLASEPLVEQWLLEAGELGQAVYEAGQALGQ